MANASRAQMVHIPKSSRAIGIAFTVLAHLLLLAWILYERSALNDEPAALPPLKVNLMPARLASAAAAPLNFTPIAPQPETFTPELLIAPPAAARTPQPAQPPAAPQPVPPQQPQQSAFAGQATASEPEFNRSARGTTGDCLPKGWLMQMSQRISLTQRYPAEARQLKQFGIAYVRVSVARNGTVLSARPLQSSGYAPLDAEAEQVFQRIGRFAPVPAKECPGYDVIVIDQPVRFRGG